MTGGSIDDEAESFKMTDRLPFDEHLVAFRQFHFQQARVLANRLHQYRGPPVDETFRKAGV